MHISRRQFISWGSAVSLALPFGAQAQAYPRKPITLLVPFAPGGNIDVLARSLSLPMAKLLGQTVLVDNRAGGGGAIGTAIAAKAEADGYTVLVTTPGQLATLPKMIKTTYTSSSLTPVGVASRTSMVVVARANDPRYKDFEQVIAAIRDRPGTLAGGHAGAGTINHLALLQLEAACRGKINPVAYRGSAPALVDLLGGQVDVVFDQITSSMPHIKSGALKALAVLSTEPEPALKGVPILSQYALQPFDATTFVGLFVPAGTPAPVIAALAAALEQSVLDPHLISTLAELGSYAKFADARTLSRHVQVEEALAVSLVKEGRLKSD